MEQPSSLAELNRTRLAQLVASCARFSTSREQVPVFPTDGSWTDGGQMSRQENSIIKGDNFAVVDSNILSTGILDHSVNGNSNHQQLSQWLPSSFSLPP